MLQAEIELGFLPAFVQYIDQWLKGFHLKAVSSYHMSVVKHPLMIDAYFG